MTLTTTEQRKEAARRIAEQAIDPARSERLRPKALCELGRLDESARHLFAGLEHHYTASAISGRLDIWGKTAHAIIDLMVSDQIPFVRREDIADYERRGPQVSK